MGRSRTVGLAALTLAVSGVVAASTVALAQDTLGPEDAPRDIVITMTDDLRFDPQDIEVVAGETVRFILENPTAATHDFTLGSPEFQEQHEVEMMAGMGHDHEDATVHDDEDAMGHDDEDATGHHDEDAMGHEHGLGEAGLPAPVTIPAGDTVTVEATFEEPGEVLIGCHQPGHWPAGMRGTITVLPA